MRTLLKNHLPPSLKDFFRNFEVELSKPQYDHFQSWVIGNLDGKVDATKISREYSDKHPSSLTRFMNSEAWNDNKLNIQRIGWAANITSQKYMKYYPLIIDDTVNEKYGKLLDGVGYHFSHMKGGSVWGQQLVTSHMVLAGTDFPLFDDLYLKEEEVTDKNKFRSKIDMALDHIKKFPKIDGRRGIVVTDTWYVSVTIMNQTMSSGFHGIFDLKSDRQVNYEGKKYSVSELAVAREKTDFDLVKIDGKLFRVWTAKLKVPRVQQKKSRLLISQQDLNYGKMNKKEPKWSKFKYLLSTDTSMGPWLIIYLYRKRWKIETFYRFVKNCFGFTKNRLEDQDAIQRYFTLAFFAYTYLALTRDPLSSYYEDTKSLYEAQNNLHNNKLEEVIEWIYDRTLQGIDLSEIKSNLGL
ncbi:MAG: transposase [Candidatus Heimdallarchaeota archaeon]